MEKEFIIIIFSENKVGLLSQITTVFTHRNVNIDSLTASESAIEGIYKYTIMVKNDPDRVENLVKQIEKKIDVLKVFCYTPDEVVLQELALYKRGRNANVHQVPKNATHEQYAKATGLECLFGALYLAGRVERLNELFFATMEEPHAL